MLAELNFVFIALLFGSHAKGNANRHSDIDILAIGGDEKEIKSALSLRPEKIHLTYVAPEDFIRMAKSREFTVVGETIKNNIILIGIEEYYRLLKNAGH
jgi:predicted nucleotidyltransferase